MLLYGSETTAGKHLDTASGWLATAAGHAYSFVEYVAENITDVFWIIGFFAVMLIVLAFLTPERVRQAVNSSKLFAIALIIMLFTHFVLRQDMTSWMKDLIQLGKQTSEEVVKNEESQDSYDPSRAFHEQYRADLAQNSPNNSNSAYNSNGELTDETIAKIKLLRKNYSIGDTALLVGISKEEVADIAPETHLLSKLFWTFVVFATTYILLGLQWKPRLLRRKYTAPDSSDLPGKNTVYLDKAKEANVAFVSLIFEALLIVSLIWSNALWLWFPIILFHTLGSYKSLKRRDRGVITVFDFPVGSDYEHCGAHWQRAILGRFWLFGRHFYKVGPNAMVFLTLWMPFVKMIKVRFEAVDDVFTTRDFVTSGDEASRNEDGTGFGAAKVNYDIRLVTWDNWDPHRFIWLSEEDVAQMKQVKVGIVEALLQEGVRHLTPNEAQKGDLAILKEGRPLNEAEGMWVNTDGELVPTLRRPVRDAQGRIVRDPITGNPEMEEIPSGQWFMEELNHALHERLGSRVTAYGYVDRGLEKEIEERQRELTRLSYDIRLQRRRKDLQEAVGAAEAARIEAIADGVSKTTGKNKEEALWVYRHIVMAERSDIKVPAEFAPLANAWTSAMKSANS